ncbi:MAG: hypothetical protein ATN36_08360 [Epulopiscium sp. Nele67-Bin005]|nr:MAG: hypothetical protein ATN36_08360 [Epulopiscium sp. Nele67-Bin005]
MKPIRLTIQGLNSFIEEQTIDFTTLSQNGLFGIFGPTGSGKSTILDGITLALYNETPRGTKNFINTQSPSANIIFEFQISGATPKLYKVQREFKYNKSGNAQAGKCKIVEYIVDEEVVLADKSTTVTKICKELVGLECDDFTRTVVLPQGKFSEFLTLTGNDRNKMLERLFHLQQYGDNLTDKLKMISDEQKVLCSTLDGELKTYAGVTAEAVEEVSQNVKAKQKQFDELKISYDKLILEFENAKTMWDLQQNLQNCLQIFESLSKQREDIKYSQKVILFAKKVLPTAEAVDKVRKQQSKINDTKESIEVIQKNRESIKESLDNISLEWNKYFSMKEEKIPQLLESHTNLNSIQKLYDETLKDKENLKSKNEQQQNISTKLQTFKTRLENSIPVIENKKLEIKQIEENITALEVNPTFEVQVDKGAKLTEDIKNIKAHIEELIENFNANHAKLKKLDEQKITLEKTQSMQKQKISLINEQLEKGVAPITEDELKQKEIELSKLEQQFQTLTDTTKQLNDLKDNIRKLNLEHEQLLSSVQQYSSELQEAKNQLKALEIESLSNQLRQNLIEGEPCSVCGSVHHNVDYNFKFDITQLNQAENKVEELTKLLETENKKLAQCEAQLKVNLDIKQNLANSQKNSPQITDCYLKEETNTILDLQDKLKNFNSTQQNLSANLEAEKEAHNLTQLELSTTNANWEITRENVKNYKQLRREQEVNLSNLEIKLQELSNLTNVEDFNKIKNELTNQKEQSHELKTILSEQKSKLQICENLAKTLTEDYNSSTQDDIKITAEIQTLEAQLAIKNQKIHSQIENPDTIQEQLINLENQINEINSNFKRFDEQKNILTNKFHDIDKNYKVSVSTLQQLMEQQKLLEETKNRLFIEHQYIIDEQVDLDHIAINCITPEELENLISECETFVKEDNARQAIISDLQNKIGNNTLTETEWNAITEHKLEKERLLETTKEELIHLNQNFSRISADYEKLKIKLTEHKEILDKQSLLEDLSKLLKGKKFVEFMAVQRLKYISIEASSRLMSITNGQYALEIKDNGNFIIRDYKNGGVEREVSTLSGGEIFITSLALALSLSAEIQLKGSSPLELFFLDEGFGTLDENLLEVVIGSLEKLHHEKLKVGIISHVEAIKERVPVKLLIAPAKSGEGGSKVKIEYS